MKSLIPVRGTRLYVEDYNESNTEALLYLHGGPGASCIDFCYQQAKKLSARIRVIAFDQRGVLRSDPIQEGEPFGLTDIVEDCEALRKYLGIDKWNVLGHSFGGHVAFLYAILYPDSVKKVIFETPCFEAKTTMELMMNRALHHFESIGHEEGIAECQKYLSGPYSPTDLWHVWGSIGRLMGERERDLIYFHGIDPSAYNEMIVEHISSNEMWGKNHQHVKKLEDEGKFFESLIPEMPKLTQPSLLLTGRFDPVCSKEQQLAFKDKVKDGSIIEFEQSGHFPRLEEPDKYTNEILQFIIGEREIS